MLQNILSTRIIAASVNAYSLAGWHNFFFGLRPLFSWKFRPRSVYSYILWLNVPYLHFATQSKNVIIFMKEFNSTMWWVPMIEAASICEAGLILWDQPHSVRQASFFEWGCLNLRGRPHSVRPAYFCRASLILWGRPYYIRLIMWGQLHPQIGPFYVFMLLSLTLLVVKARIGSFLLDRPR